MMLRITIRRARKDYTCDKCGKRIFKGEQYKGVRPYRQPIRRRHKGAPDWEWWESSSTLSAQLQRVVAGIEQTLEAEFDGDDLSVLLNDAVGEIRELVEARLSAAQAMEDGLNAQSPRSLEMREHADSLREFADLIEGVVLPDAPTVSIINDQDAMFADEWRDEIRDQVRNALAELPDVAFE